MLNDSSPERTDHVDRPDVPTRGCGAMTGWDVREPAVATLIRRAVDTAPALDGGEF